MLIDSPSYDYESKKNSKNEKAKDSISLTEDNADQIAAMLKAKMQ